MKRLSVVTLIAGIAVLGACKKSVEPGTERTLNITLQHCATIFSGDGIGLCFDSVISDSRCPADVVCVWAGAATAKFTFTKHNETHRLTLSTINMGSSLRKDTTLAGYKIEFLDLTPYPRVHPTNPLPEESKAKVKVTKL